MFDKIRRRVAKAISNDAVAYTPQHMLQLSGYDSPQLQPGEIIDDTTLELMVRDGGYARKLVTVPVEDAIRNWRRWTGDEAQNKAIELTERRLGVQQVLANALIFARAYGGCAILIGVEGQGDVNQPIDPSLVTAETLKYLQIIPRNRFVIGQIDTRVGSITNGEPLTYRLNPTSTVDLDVNNKAMIEIDRSRLVIIKGDYTPNPYGTQDVRGFWGYSILQALYPALFAVNRANMDISGLVNVAQTPALGIKGYRRGLAEKEITAQDVAMEMAETDRNKSAFNTILIDSEDKYTLNSVSFASLPQTNRELMIALSAQSGIPQSKLFSIQQAGLGEIGGAQRKDYQDLVRGIQVTKLQAPMSILDQCIVFASLGTNLSAVETQTEMELSYEWSDLETPTEQERVATALMGLDIITKAQTAGIIDVDRAKEDYEKINPRTSENS